MKRYILKDGVTTEEPDLMKWAEFMEGGIENRRLAMTEVPSGKVYTSFLGIDHNWTMEGPPILWETMACIDGVWQDYQRRYSDPKEALIGHAQAVALFSNLKRDET